MVRSISMRNETRTPLPRANPQRRQLDTVRLGLRALKLLAVCLLLISARQGHAALKIRDYDPARHDRFVNDPGFVGNPHDWSGVGRGDRWATLISPSYFLSAKHYHPAVNSKVTFYSGNDAGGPFVEGTVAEGQQIDGSDLWLGKLAEPLDTGRATTYPILSLSTHVAYEQLELYTFGRSDTSPSQTNMRLGRNELDEVVEDFELSASIGDVFIYDYDRPDGGVGGDESYLQPGDSGGPTFTILGDTPTLLGIHWFIYDDYPNEGDVGSGDTLVASYTDSLSSLMGEESITIICEGDATVDGAVGGSDLNLLLSDYGETDTDWARGDFNGDAMTDGTDLNLLLSNYGFGGQAGAASGHLLGGGELTPSHETPEPSCLVMLLGILLGGGTILPRRWRQGMD